MRKVFVLAVVCCLAVVLKGMNNDTNKWEVIDRERSNHSEACEADNLACLLL